MSPLLLLATLATAQTQPPAPVVPAKPMPAATAPAPTAPAVAEPEKPAEPEKEAEKATEPDTGGPLSMLLADTALAQWAKDHKLKVSGYTNASFTPSTSSSRTHLPVALNYRANDFLLQQNTIRVERAVDTDSKDPSFGFRTDLIVPGSDARFTIVRGLWDSQLTDSRSGGPIQYPIDPVQFYSQAYLPGIGNGLDLKAGRFFALIGSESIDPTQNKLGSRSYAFQYNPFTHTGVLAATTRGDWTFQNGITTGSDIFIDPAATPTYVGQAKWAPKDGDTNVSLSAIVGSGRFDVNENHHNPDVFDLVINHKINDCWSYTGNAVYGFTRDVPGIGFANWYSVVNYLTRTFNDKTSMTARLEFFDDVQGQRTGTSGLYTAATLGVTYKPMPWLWLRPEARYDHNNNRPFAGDRSLGTFGLDAIVLW